MHLDRSPLVGDRQAVLAEGLVKSFRTVRALDGVDLEVPTGTVPGLLGPNGAGKTTAVRILTTLLPPDGGRALRGLGARSPSRDGDHADRHRPEPVQPLEPPSPVLDHCQREGIGFIPRFPRTAQLVRSRRPCRRGGRRPAGRAARRAAAGRSPDRAPIAHHGPFVMNTRQEIIQAVEDHQAGRLGIIPADQLAPRSFA